MSKKTFLAIISCLVLSILPIWSLWLFAHGNPSKNGFLRSFASYKVEPISSFKLPYSTAYIAGVTGSCVYLENFLKRYQLLSVNYRSSDMKYIEIPAPDTAKVAWQKIRPVVDSPYIYISEGVTPAFLQSNLTTLKIDRYKSDTSHFSIAIPISTSSYALRIHDHQLKQYVLGKETLFPASVKRAPDDLLEKQVDGVFSADGKLLYNKEQARIFYLYYYRNQILCLDTNLNLIYKSHTIDTVTRPALKIAHSQSKNNYTLSEPPPFVNKESCTAGEWLFIVSPRKADNEQTHAFNDVFTIDVYAVSDGKYKSSFYLPRRGNQKLHSLYVLDKTLFVIIDDHLNSYRLSF